MADGSSLDEAAALVAEGRPVDWPTLLAAASPEDRPLLEQLRVMAAVASEHGGPVPEDPGDRRSWGPFEVLGLLDRGAYGVVLRGRDPRVDRLMAIKLLAGEATGREARFVEEARAIARVDHPNVVSVYGADVFDGVAGTWMELVEGSTLDRIVARDGPLGARETVLVGLDLCGALSAVHGAGLVHRDVKAANIVRETGGRIVLMDFGGVQAVERPSRGAVGTPLFMAPELLEGAAATTETDLYALAVVLFLLVTGAYPVTGDSLDEIRQAHRAGRRRLVRDVRAAVTSSLADVIDRALSPDRKDRYASAAALQRALRTALDLGPEVPAGRGRRPRLGRLVPGWVLLPVVALTVAATLAVGPLLGRLGLRNSPVQAHALTENEWTLVEGYRDLGDTMAARGDWAPAAATFRNAAKVFIDAQGELSTAAAPDLARAAFAADRAGDPDGAQREYVRALYRLAEVGGEGHPLRPAIEAARAVSFQQRGELQEAVQATLRAIRLRRAMLGLAGEDGAPPPGFAVSAIESALRSHQLDADADGDWLPDAIEVAVGLNPGAIDSDGDGLEDGLEDSDGDGLANAITWGLVPDPNLVAGTFGPADPRQVAARADLPGTIWQVSRGGRPTRSLGMRTNRTAVFAMRLTDAQRRAAFARGWRLFLRAHPVAGQAFAVLDPMPHGRLFAINLFATPGGAPVVRLFHRTMPRESLDFQLDLGSSMPLLVLQYDPRSRRASFSVDGVVRTVDYAGIADMQSGRGVAWGVTNNLATVPVAEAHFEVVGFEIKP